MDWLVFGLLFSCATVAGWVMGVIGFFGARRAQREIAALRAQLLALSPAMADSAEPVPTHEAQLAATVPVPDAAVGPTSPDPWATPAAVASVAAEPTPDARPTPTPTPTPTPSLGARLEDLLALRWGMWLGAAALLLAGVFLVRTAIEEDWLGPTAKCAAAALLGLALAAAAEWLHRRPTRPLAEGWPDLGPGALAAGSAATLFGAAYSAAALYQLVPPLFGFVLMAAAASAGLLLSLRFGPLAAAVGVAGAMATPALVQTAEPSLPGLFAYLLAVTAAAMAVVRYTAWGWLGWCATLAGAAWVVLGGSVGATADLWAPALFIPAAAALHLGLLPGLALDHPLGRRLSWVPLLGLGVAGLVLATGTQEAWPRAGVLLLLVVAAAKAWQEPRLDRLPWLAAALGLCTLLAWALVPVPVLIEPPPLAPALPGPIQAFLWACTLYAGFAFAAGSWQERQAPHPLRWTVLSAGLPAPVLAIAWWRAGPGVLPGFLPDMGWAGLALLVAAVHTGAALLAAREGSPRRAGAHAAGAVAALCLLCTVLLRDQWLTVAISLMLPALAWIAAQSDLRPLRGVALALALVVLARLLLNWEIAGYPVGTAPVLNGLLPAYALPAVSFAVSALMFRRRGDDMLVAVLQAGACAFGTALVAVEIRHWAQGGTLWDGDRNQQPGFLEGALYASAFWALANLTQWLARARNGRSVVLEVTWRLQAAMGMAAGLVLLAANPLWVPEAVGAAPLWNALLPAYLLPGLLAGLLQWGWPESASARRWFGLRAATGVYGLVSLFAWVNLQVRHLFNPTDMTADSAGMGQAELWAYSGAWLAFGAALMIAGLRRGAPRGLRLAAFGVIGMAAIKATFVDTADLSGLWRVLSFLGLGLTLIALGALYRRFGGPARDQVAT